MKYCHCKLKDGQFSELLFENMPFPTCKLSPIDHLATDMANKARRVYAPSRRLSRKDSLGRYFNDDLQQILLPRERDPTEKR